MGEGAHVNFNLDVNRKAIDLADMRESVHTSKIV